MNPRHWIAQSLLSASALSLTIYFTFFLLFFSPRWRTLLQCNVVGENWMNNLPWETNNIMDPECLLSVMRPNRRLDRRKWCVVLYWDNGPGPPLMAVAAEIWSVHKPQVCRTLEGRRGKGKLAEQGKWVTPRREWGRWETLQVPRVHVSAPSLSQHMQIGKALTSEHLEIQETLEMKYRKLLTYLWIFHLWANSLLGTGGGQHWWQ